MTQAAESPRADTRLPKVERGREVRAAARDKEDVRKTQGAIIRRLEGCTDVQGWKKHAGGTAYYYCSDYEEYGILVSWSHVLFPR